MKKYLGVLTALLCSASWFSSCELNEMNDVTFSGMQYSDDRISSCKFYICDINNLPNL